MADLHKYLLQLEISQVARKIVKHVNQQSNVLYEIKCLHCRIKYVGETSTTIRSGIKEHLNIDKQTVYKHILSHGIGSPEQSDVTWKILHKNMITRMNANY